MTTQALSVSMARVFARPADGDIWLGPLQLAAKRSLLCPGSLKLLIGPASCGKTSILAHLVRRHAASGAVLSAAGPIRDARQLLAVLLASGGLTDESLRESDLRKLLAVLIERRHFERRQPLLVVDNVQRLGPSAWQELERLHRQTCRSAPSTTLLLAATGTPNPQWQLSAPTGSVPIVHVLEYPGVRQLGDYLRWRLSRFGIERRFTPLALRLITQLSAGRYRAANLLAQLAMLEQIRTGATRIDARIVQDAATRFGQHRGVEPAAPEQAVDPSAGSVLQGGYNEPPGHVRSG